MQSNPTKWAIQKNGRLTAKSLEIINRVYGTILDIDSFAGGEYLEDPQREFAIFLVRDDDIAFLVQGGYCEVGICSEVIREEAEISDLLCHKLNFSLCNLVYAEHGTPNEKDNALVTKFPHIAARLFADRFTIIKMHGGSELSVQLGLASCILELTQSGRSLEKYGYKIVQTIKEYDTELIVQKNMTDLFAEIIRKIAVPN